jgi:hypothetical protein
LRLPGGCRGFGPLPEISHPTRITYADGQQEGAVVEKFDYRVVARLFLKLSKSAFDLLMMVQLDDP